MDNICSICNNKGIFKIKGEKIYYCREHAVEFFDLDSLESIEKLEKGIHNANKLKDFLIKKN